MKELIMKPTGIEETEAVTQKGLTPPERDLLSLIRSRGGLGVSVGQIADAFLAPVNNVGVPAPPTPLSETETDFLETQVPHMAQAAAQTAFWHALSRGQTVVCKQGDELAELSRDGSRRVLDRLEVGPSLPVGTTIAVR